MIGIVGGGISGLALAHYLRGAGVPHVLFERDRVPGGVMRTRMVDGVPLDLGPQRMRLTAAAREIVDSAGLAAQILVASERLPLWIYRRGRLRTAPLTPGQALSTDLIGWGAKLRILLEPFTRGPSADESVEGFFVRKFGREAYEAFLGPLYGGLYASDPAAMRTRHGLGRTLEELGVEGSLLLALVRRGARAREAVPTVTFRDGLGALPARLAALGGEAVRLGTGVSALEKRPGGWTLHLDGAGAGESVDVERVVLALPAPAAASVLRAAAPEAAERVGRLRYNPLAVVHLRGDCRLEGLGYQVAFGEALETRGVTWNASMFGRSGIHTAYLGGMKNPGLVDWDDARIARLAETEFARVSGCEAEARLVSRTSIPAWDASWDALAGVVWPAGLEVCTSWIARPGIPGRLQQAKRLAERLAQKAHI